MVLHCWPIACYNSISIHCLVSLETTNCWYIYKLQFAFLTQVDSEKHQTYIVVIKRNRQLYFAHSRVEGTFRWLKLPIVEISHLSVFFFRVLRRRKHIFSLIITTVNFHHNLLVKLQNSCYTAALVENFVATLLEVIFLHAARFCSLYGNILVFQSLATFLSKYQVPVQRLDTWMALTNL